MKIEDIISLANAGFTPDQITTLAGIMTEKAPPQQETQHETRQETQQETRRETQQETRTEREPSDYQKLLEQFNALSDQLKSMQILNSRQPEVKHESAEMALASVIAPPR